MYMYNCWLLYQWVVTRIMKSTDDYLHDSLFIYKVYLVARCSGYLMPSGSEVLPECRSTAVRRRGTDCRVWGRGAVMFVFHF